MATTGKPTPDASDIEAQIKTIREDISKLTTLMKDVGEGKISEAADVAKAEAEKLLGKAKQVTRDASDKTQEKVASVENYIHEKPVQSVFVALLLGLLIGSMSRR